MKAFFKNFTCSHPKDANVDIAIQTRLNEQLLRESSLLSLLLAELFSVL